MTDAPERIWACMGGPMVGMFVSGGNNGGWPEYVRADIVQSLPAERDRLRGGIEYVLDGYGLKGPDYRFQDGEDGDWITDQLIAVIKGETP